MRSGKIKSKSLILLLVVLGCKAYLQNNENLIILSNKNIEVGILTDVGGKIILLRKPGFKNILKSDEKVWENPEKQKPGISAFISNPKEQIKFLNDNVYLI